MKKIIILLILTVLFCVGCTAECEDAMTYKQKRAIYSVQSAENRGVLTDR